MFCNGYYFLKSGIHQHFWWVYLLFNVSVFYIADLTTVKHDTSQGNRDISKFKRYDIVCGYFSTSLFFNCLWKIYMLSEIVYYSSVSLMSLTVVVLAFIIWNISNIMLFKTAFSNDFSNNMQLVLRYNIFFYSRWKIICLFRV